MTVTRGTMALRSACRQTMRASDKPLARAVAHDGQRRVDGNHPPDEEGDGQQPEVGDRDDQHKAGKGPQLPRSPRSARLQRLDTLNM